MDKFLIPARYAIRCPSHSIARLGTTTLSNYTLRCNSSPGLMIQVRNESTKKPLENLSPFTMKFFTKDSEDIQPETQSEKPIISEIKSVIEEKIRPTIQEDGGDIEFVSYENNIVKVRLQGACVSCPSSTVTLKSGVKNMLQYHFEEIEDVEQVFDDEDDDE